MIIIGGLVGPLGDGYGAGIAPSADVAESMIRPQAEALEAQIASLRAEVEDQVAQVAAGQAALEAMHAELDAAWVKGTELDAQLATQTVAAAEAAREQSAVSDEINQRIISVADVAARTVELAESTLGRGRATGEDAHRLEAIVGQFKF